MYERFTDRARKVMQLANQEAQRFNHEYIGTEHILLGLVKEGLGHAVLPSYTLSNYDDPSPFEVRSIHSPRIMSELMLVRSSRRPSTETQKIAIEVVKAVLVEAMKPYT